MDSAIGNLKRITIHQYKLKLLHNSYPLIRSEYGISNLELVNLTLFRRHDSPSPFDLNLEQKLFLLDFFNSSFRPCQFCRISYSFDVREIGEENYQVCMPCYILTQTKPIHFYISSKNGVSYLSTLSHSVSIPDFEVIVEIEQEEELMNYIHDELSQTETVDGSLDQYF